MVYQNEYIVHCACGLCIVNYSICIVGEVECGIVHTLTLKKIFGKWPYMPLLRECSDQRQEPGVIVAKCIALRRTLARLGLAMARKRYACLLSETMNGT